MIHASSRSKRIVLFLPHRADPDEGVRVAADLLPLELLQIASVPYSEGYEVHVVDAMVEPDYMAKLEELCDGALLFAGSCILGFQVVHGARVARRLRERFPDLPMVWGGWFPSVVPELYLREGIADAVGLGQGELTFGDVVRAIESGEPLGSVPGLAVLEDGQVRYTDHRPVVGFDKFPKVPWDLLDFEKYVHLQQNPGRAKIRHKLPDPLGLPAGTKLRTFSYFSSFGCPEPCTFCCSPRVTGRRWKALTGKDLAEDLFELQDRFKFNHVRFQDANFGVAEKRSNEFCEALIEAGSPYWWNATYEVETIARYKEASCDLLRDAKCHLVILGAEAGSKEQQERIKKKIDLDTNLELALGRIYERGIQTGTTWIIGYPGEEAPSMVATIDMAAKMKHRFPGSASDIFPFRPIPGTEDFDESVKLGYQPPRTFEEWGSCLEYKYETNDISIPEEIELRWRRYGSTATFYDGLTKHGSSWVRRAMQRMSGWRLAHGEYRFPIEQKLYDLYVRASGKSEADAVRADRTSGVTPNPVSS
ncbi:B12 binding domain protein [Planctomycetes bacterium Pla163]|uniref:B12 binding domain protein n=1 Tax=Rohdeia mirabilis TaxID=2528008 RepID=A0A518D0Z3_9BACT|nr:B12 binding domain protein [Planctomycetes bacterium Pla163]